MALDLPLPRQIFAHAHWTLGRVKMSKSRGNVVNPFFALDRFGVDTLRYFLALKGGIKDDAMYDNDLISTQYEADLRKGLGNLLSRVVRGKGWDVRQAVQQNGQAVQPQNIARDERSIELEELLKELPSVVSEKIENQLDLGSALESIMNVMRKVFPLSPLPLKSTSTSRSPTPKPKLSNPLTRQTATCKPNPHGTSTDSTPTSTASSTSAPTLSASSASCSSLSCPLR